MPHMASRFAVISFAMMIDSPAESAANRRQTEPAVTDSPSTAAPGWRRSRRWLLALGLLAMTGLTSGWIVWQAGHDEGGGHDNGQPAWWADFKPTVWPQADHREAVIWQRHLEPLPELVGGSGFIAHQGRAVFRWGNDHHSHYVASAMKPFLSALLLLALEHELIDDLHSPVAEVVPDLAGLNDGVDGGITWYHLATMTSGYGVSEGPGEAFAYNDYAVQLLYDALMGGVFGSDGDQILQEALTEPLGWEDRVTFRGFGDDGPEPKMRASARDLAKFGQWLLDGSVAGAQMRRGEPLSPTSMQKLRSLAVDESVPFTTAEPAPMLPGQGTVGGGEPNLMTKGPGRYGFHLWHNRSVAGGGPMIPDAPTGSLLAVGKLGQSVLWIVPEWQLVVAWTNSEVTDKKTAATDPDAAFNRVARLLAAAVEEARAGLESR